jgi:cation:H+ antiporter
MDYLFLLLGLAMLASGGDALVRGSLAAAKLMGISPLLSGLLIVGFGTSMPELMVSVIAALSEQADIAIGNVVGSNISNIMLILGSCALLAPMTVSPSVLRRDAVTGVAASLLFVALVGGGALGRSDAVVFLLALAAFLVWAYRSERVDALPSAELHMAEANELTVLPRSAGWMVVAVFAGLLLLILGSRILLLGAIGIASRLGVSEAVIGLTVVAVGTSLPELSTSVVATLRRHADVAVGNVLGSNIFNLLGILGVSALLQPLPVHARILQFDQWVMLGSSVLLLLLLYTGSRLSRAEGAVLLAGYVAYISMSFSSFVVSA